METVEKMEVKKEAEVYLACGIIGDVKRVGSPIAHFKLMVDEKSSKVVGVVQITQATVSQPIVVDITGVIRYAGLGSITKIVALEGQYTQSVPPPAIGTWLENFSAHMGIDNAWNGRGGFTFGHHVVEDVPVYLNPRPN